MKKYVLIVAALLAYAVSQAQVNSGEIVTKFNEGVAALQAKDWTSALASLEKVVNDGIDSEDNQVLSCVTTAKKYIPTCYQGIGLKAAAAKDYDKAIENLSKAAEKAELYGNQQAQAKANSILAKVYQAKGGEAYNNKDYAKAAEIFQKGYEANPRNTDMALNLAMSYCESGQYQKGIDVYEAIIALPAEKYAEPIAKAKEMVTLYTNNEVARLQQAGDFDSIIALADAALAKDPSKAIAQKIRVQAYAGKKDYTKVIELGEAAAAAQVSDEDRSAVYFLLGAAYNAKEQKPQAIAALSKVTSGASVEAAKKALADLQK